MKYFQEHILPIQNKLFRFALRIVGNTEEAEDVVQEVFLKLWRQKQQWPNIQNIEAWSMRLTKNLSIDRLRRVSRREESLEQVYHSPALQPTPAQITESKDSLEQIKKFMEQLPEKQRLVIHLRDIEELSYKEISEVLEMPMSQVKTNLFRGRNALREMVVKSEWYEQK
ncbi:MAG: DNA-directed RNA polymerase sigma-70 factor [Saprospiraceae bacterium]|nr:MAG: DNA-directed RNA polymerase sigma-70 factor [Saprospiraceae bacterium]